MAALPAWVPIALMAGGTALQMGGEHAAEKDRRKILNRGFEEVSKSQDEAAQELTEEGSKFTAGNRAAEMQGLEEAAYSRTMNDLGGAAGVTQAAGDGGRQSSEFVKAKAGKAITEGNRITEIAREAAKGRATGDQVMQEGLRRAEVIGSLNSRGADARRMATASNFDAQNVEIPGYGQLGQMATLLGGAMSAGAGAAGAAGGAAEAGTAVGAGEAVAGGSTGLAGGANYIIPGSTAANTAAAGSSMFGNVASPQGFGGVSSLFAKPKRSRIQFGANSYGAQ